MRQLTPGTVTFGVVAILCGLAAAYGVRHYLTSRPSPAPAEKAATVSIAVASANLPKYSRIRAEDVQMVDVPREKTPDGAISVKTRALSRLVKTTVLAGQPILEQDLFGVGEVPLLSQQLPPGFRAVTLTIDANSALNGMIQPDSCVDIALTLKNDRPEIGGLATLTMLEGVRVLATSEARFPSTEDRAGQLRNVTVAVTPEQANKLILAQRSGTLSVTLRSSSDAGQLSQQEGQKHLVNSLDLLGLEPIAATQPEPAPALTAQIWRGDQVQNVTFDAWHIEEANNATAVAEGRQPTKIFPASAPRPTPAKKKDCPDCDKKKSNGIATRSSLSMDQGPTAPAGQ